MRTLIITIILAYLSIVNLYADSKTVLLTSIARDAILESLTNTKRIDKEAMIKEYPFLAQEGAVFVTLNKQHRLRGCIGSLKAYRPLINDIVANARAAAFEDNRFYPVGLDEFDAIEIEVSVLTPPEKIVYSSVEELKQKVRPHTDGIILKAGKHRATYLPQVWEQMSGFDEFFSFLCRKAGLDANCLALHPTLYRYSDRKYSEAGVRKRRMANAGTFYPKRCAQTLDVLSAFEKRAMRTMPEMKKIKAIVVPHAGYKYSGITADFAYRLAAKSAARHVVVLGPSHFVRFEGISSVPADAFETPCGLIANDKRMILDLEKRFRLVYNPEAHAGEHSTEVQLPFIHHYLPQRSVTELIYGNVDKTELLQMVQWLLKQPDVLLIVSTDLSHYYSQKKAHRLDFACMDALTDLSAKKLHKCEACGKAGLTALVEAAKHLGLKSKLIDYRTSADATGDTSRVVGYMSAVLYQ
jgi:AmmeMemoRadiSam system protein B/AmmeMemoRadiSam system protein A